MEMRRCETDPNQAHANQHPSPEKKMKKKKAASAGSWSFLRHRLDPQLSFSQMTNAFMGWDLFYPPPLLPVSLQVSMSPDKRKGTAAIWAASRQPGSEARHQDAAEKLESPSQGWVIQELSRSSCSERQRQLTRSLAFSRRLSRHGMNRACQSDEAASLPSQGPVVTPCL